MKLHVNLHNNYMFYNINYFKKSLKTHFPNSSSHFSTPLNKSHLDRSTIIQAILHFIQAITRYKKRNIVTWTRWIRDAESRPWSHPEDRPSPRPEAGYHPTPRDGIPVPTGHVCTRPSTRETQANRNLWTWAILPRPLQK